MSRKLSSLQRALVATMFSIGLLPAAHAYPWTSAGSTGTPDEDALPTDLTPGKITMNLPYATLKATQASMSATIRYNVTAVFDKSYIFTPYLQMRFLDSGATTRVYAALRAYNTTNGSGRLLATLDSNSFPASAAYQTQISCTPNNQWINDFVNEVYYVEVTLSRTSTAGSAVVAALRVDECVW
jgi:hypothetical protein